MRVGTEYNRARWRKYKSTWGPAHRKWYAENREHAIEYAQKYAENHRDQVRLGANRRYALNKAKLNSDPVVLEKRRKYYANRRIRIREIRKEVIAHYSNGTMSCKVCGFSDIRALCIDHINDDGARHRESIGSGATATLTNLQRNNYPDGYQILCANCNQIKEMVRRQA